MITKNINSTSGKKYEEITVPGIVYDDEPVEGSFNGITSDAVVKAIDEAKEDMQGKIDEVTLDPSAVALGNVHLLDEATEFPADGCILIDSETDGPGEMSKDTLLELTAQNAKEKVFDELSEHFSFSEDDGNLYVIDSFGSIALIIDKTGHLIVPSVTGVNQEVGFVDAQGRLAIKVDYSGKVRFNIAVDCLQKILNSLGEQVKACGSDYFVSTPRYVFGIESSTLRGREYFTGIYPEGMVNKDFQFFINGFKKFLFQKIKSAGTLVYNDPVYEEIFNCNIKAPFYREKIFDVKYIRANRKNAQNKKIHWLAIGDSLTAASDSNFPDGVEYGGYVNGAKQFAIMDSADIGDIALETIGTENRKTISLEYDGNTYSVKSTSEGLGGWGVIDYANYPFHVHLRAESGYMTAEGLYYACGLATKTPYDSSTPGQPYTAYTADDDTWFLIASTPLGRFKPDCNATLWAEMKRLSDFTGTGDYSGASSDAIMVAYLEDKETHPENKFYDQDVARAYTGSHEWTYTCAFSIAKYLERYRTYDDDGNKLTLGDGTGTEIDASNINLYVVMTPTHLTICLGTNDRDITQEYQAALVIQFMKHVAATTSNTHIGYFLPRITGVLSQGNWEDVGLINKVGRNSTLYRSNSVKTNSLIADEFKSLPSGYGVTYIPVYYTGSPMGGAGSHLAEDIDTGNLLCVSGKDSLHPDGHWYKSAAYQVLSWIYWTLRA